MKRKCSNVCWWQECTEVNLEVPGELEGMEDQLTCSVTATHGTGEFFHVHITLKHKTQQHYYVALLFHVKYNMTNSI